MTYDGDGVAGGEAASGGPNYAQGRLTKARENTDADAAAEVVHCYAYDHLGNVRVKQVEIEGLTGAKQATYDHDLAGRVTRLTYPDGAQARYAYDGAGRLSRVWNEQGNTLAAYTHTAAGNVNTHVVGHDVADGAGDAIAIGTYAYNPREWVTGIDYPGRFTLSQQYDHAGNVTAQNYRAAADSLKAATYTYDSLHRLTGFSLDGSSRRSYRYDRSGNITRVVTGGSTLSYNYSAASTPNRLDSTTGTGGMTFAYNRNGWMTAMGDASLTYDYRGLATGHGNARYLMDPDQRRVKKTIGTAVTYYLRGADGSVLAEYTDQTQSARYVYAGGRRIARVEGSGIKRYYLADHLGSTRSLVDEEGAVTAAYDYWPYGKILATSGMEATHFRFTRHERDPESGLDYMPARSYAYDTGRFLRPDPMQDEYPGISPYAYAANNPLKYVDPDGRIVFPAVFGLLYAATEVASTGYDAYNLYETIQDPKSTKLDVGMAVVGLGLGTALPGPGSAYTKGAKTLLKKVGGYVKKAYPGGKGNVIGLGNPFKGKSPRQIDRMFKNKGFETRGKNPRKGKGGYVNPKTGRSYHIDRKNRSGEPTHVDVNRSKSYKGHLEKKKYFTGEGE